MSGKERCPDYRGVRKRQVSGIGVWIREVSVKERLPYLRGVRIGEVSGKESGRKREVV